MADPTNENDEAKTDTPAETGENAGSDSPASVATDKATDVGADDSQESLATDDIEKLLAEASQNLDQAVDDSAPAAAGDGSPKPYALGDLTPDSDANPSQPIDLLGEVEMDLRVELGRTRMRLEEVLQLRGGSVVALDKLAGDPVDIFVNGRLVARGEVLVMNDNFCIRVTELVGA
ncbi:Flagellar motor switch protein FliN [Rubripirellula obstinata]|uniref:Flagellar motor switch protein FliN n=1 Tax=Rubripirellula obstinata TaxID=406547 RepID=A0A5B1CLA5_9BACT|nr:flagellar motor switch protein FliN [Rubripirellula obstinata]KAA1260310.1 Flagellar motor switch protein FliN [Rubripirellula obstinata]